VLERDDAIFHNIHLFEVILKNLVALLNLIPVHELQGIWVRMLHLLGLLLNNISCIERLDRANTNWDEFIPVNQFVLVFISKSNQHVDVVIIETI